MAEILPIRLYPINQSINDADPDWNYVNADWILKGDWTLINAYLTETAIKILPSRKIIWKFEIIQC